LKSTLWTWYGYFKYFDRHFVIANICATNEHMINKILENLIDQCIIIYINNILIYSAKKRDYQYLVIKVQLLKQKPILGESENIRIERLPMVIISYINFN
jgi:hypothetical protein